MGWIDIRIFAAALIFSTFPWGGLADAGDFYKWVDKDGNVHYSDNKSGAPVKGGKVEERDFSEIDLNVAPAPQWPPSLFPESENKRSSKPSERVEGLPWFTQSNFDREALGSSGLTIVEFWAVWCGVCRRVDPVINRLASEFSGKVRFGRVDIDQDKELGRKYSVKGVPNFVFFKNGKIVGRMVGGYARESYVKKIEELM